jgi:hypothetical protein
MTGDMYATAIWPVTVLHDMEKAEVRVSSLNVEPVFSVSASEARKRGGPGGRGGSGGGGIGSEAGENEVISFSLPRGSSYFPPGGCPKAYRPSPGPDCAIIQRPEAGEAAWRCGGCDIGVVVGGGGDGGLGCSSSSPLLPHLHLQSLQPQHSSESLLPRGNTVEAKETYYGGKRDLAPDAAAVGVAAETVTQTWGSSKPQMFGVVKGGKGAALARMPFRELQRGGIMGTTRNVRYRDRG